MEEGGEDLPPASPADAPMPTLDPQVGEDDEEGTEYGEDDPAGEEAEEEEEGEEEEEDIPEDADNTPSGVVIEEEEDDEEDLTEEDFLPEDTDGPPKIKEEEEEDDEEDDSGPVPRKRSASVSSEDGPKRKLGRSLSSSAQASGSGEGHDNYCWVCHKEGVFYHCKSCPRSYHTKCITLPDFPDPAMSDGDESKFCVCPECLVVLNAENVESRSEAMKQLSMDELMNMLKYICGRMRATPGSEPFLKPVNPLDAVDYRDYIVHPMDIFTLEKNIKMRHYGSTEAFLSEAQWLVHNSIIFNSSSSPYTAAAKRLLKVCKQELAEIETCPECYNNAHIKADTWFIEACKRPHILVWAKLKGFPFWPAKAMKIKDDVVDVRFFGQHDRAWVALKDCYLYSSEMPSAPPKKNSNLLAAIDELNAHVEKLKEKYGEVVFHPAKTHLGPSLSIEQIRKFTPKYVPEEPSKQRASVPISTNKVKPTLTATPGKSPISITISLKSSPTIVNSVTGDKPDKRPEEKEKPKKAIETPIPPIPPTQSDPSEPQDEEMEEEESEEPLQIAEKPEEISEDEEPEPETKPEVKEEEIEVPSGEILASALGLRRIQRKSSTNSNLNESDDGIESKKLKMALQGSHRDLVKDLPLKIELREKEGSEEETKRLPARVSTIYPSNVRDRDLRIKEEKDEEEMEEDEDEGILKRKNQLIQISSKAQSKPGYRFNITKDISISAISEGEDENEGKGQNQQLKNLQASLNLPQGMQITSAVTNPKHRFPQGQGVQRFLSKGDAHARASILRAGQQGPMKMGNQSMKQRMGAGRPSHQLQMLKRVQGKGIVVDSTSLQRVDEAFCGSMSGGAITLPGGTITVTPLSSFPSGQNGGPKGGLMATNGMNMMSPDGGGSSPMNPATIIDRSKGGKKGRSILPPSVQVQVQSLSKGVIDLVRNAVETMAAELLENGAGGKGDPKALQAENEKMKLYHQAEMLELRHNHDIAMRELRLNMENEKKRAVGEARRQLEQDKKTAVEETKKKQWCANCGREALFYCCWNTSYCGYNCQENHWPSHLGTCTQSQGGGKGH